MNTENAKLDHILTGDEEQQLVAAVISDGRVTPRLVVPTLIDVYRPRKRVTYARGYIYGPEDSIGISESFMIVGRKEKGKSWIWAWVEDNNGTIIQDIEDNPITPVTRLSLLNANPSSETTFEEF